MFFFTWKVFFLKKFRTPLAVSSALLFFSVVQTPLLIGIFSGTGAPGGTIPFILAAKIAIFMRFDRFGVSVGKQKPRPQIVTVARHS